jgi:RNA polymerase sigma-70 factor (ECF subfamily)
MDTLPLIERIRRGEREAFTPLFEKYRPRLAAFIYYKAGTQAREKLEIDDLVQETFLQAFRQFDNFTYREPGSFFRWLARIAEHILIDAVRYETREKRRGEKVRFRSESNPDGPEPVDSLTPSRMLARREAIERLFEKLDALPENFRQAIVMARIEGLSTAEIAGKLGKSREAVSLILHRALKQLRSLEQKADS